VSDIRDWLEALALGDYAEAFEAEKISPDAVPELTEDDLKELGLAMGPRRIFLKAAKVLATSEEKENGADETPDETATEHGEAERRQLTVMFCDLVGSTALSEKLDPEDLRALMQAYQQAAGAVIERYEGHVAQYLGDGLMAYFGWPKAHEDDAGRAIRAGLEVVDAVGEIEATAPLSVRVGIATGPVVVGETGAGDASVPKAAVGETPNLAARVQGLAAPNTVAIAEATRRLVGGVFELEDLGPRHLKGIESAVGVWRVLGESAAESRFEAAHVAGLTPLVGREAEIAMLLDRWRQAQAGDGQVVILSGEPGIGKSRITQELRDLVAGDRPIGLRYQCSPHHTDSAFYPVISQLEQAAGFNRDDAAAARLDKLEAVIAESGTDLDEVGALFATLMGLPAERYPAPEGSGQKRKNLTLRALVGQVLALARRAPVLLVFEDAHWIDPTTQEALDMLVPALDSAPVLAVITCRPEYVAPWRHGHVTTHVLNRLGRRQGADVVAEVTGGKDLPEAVLDQIVAKSDGVPIFIEELTKTVLEAGFLKDAGDRYELDGPLPALAVPATLHDSLMARLDRQGADKDVAQIAACIGREFPFDLVAAVSPLSDDQLADALQRLADSQLIFALGARPDATYSFKHALVRDAAYESLLKSRRQILHGEIGAAMEAGPAGSPEHKPESIAYHFARGARWRDAVDYFRKAAKTTARGFAIKEALSLNQQALDAAAHLDPAQAAGDIMAIHERRSGLFFLIGDFSDARREWSDVLTVARRIGDRHRECAALAGLAGAYMWEEDFDQALAHADEAAALAEAIDAPELLASARTTTGSVQAVSGRLDEAKQELNAAIAIAHSAGSAAHESMALYMSGNIENWHGRFDKAIELAAAGARLAHDNNLTALYLRCNYAHAIALAAKGAYDPALSLFNDGLRLAEKLGDEAFIPRYQNGLGWLYMECQDSGRGLELNHKGAEMARTRKHAIGVEMTAFAEVNMADIFLAQGDLGQAFDMLDGVHRVCVDPAGHTWMKWRYSAHMFVSLGRLWLTRGDVRKAEEFAERCLTIATQTNSRKYIAKAWLLQGEIAIARKAWDEAQQSLGQALKLAAAIGNPPLTVAAHMAVGGLHGETKRDDKARHEYQAARAIVERIKADTKDADLRNALDNAPAFRQFEQL